MILTKYKNNLLAIIQESGLEPNLFIAKEEVINKTKYFTISLRDSKILFAVRPWGSSFESFLYCHSLFRADFGMTDAQYTSNFDSLAEIFKGWLEEVVKPYLDNISTPDLWLTLEENRTRTKDKTATPEDFEAFSDEEKIQIRLSLNDFRLLIVKNFKPNKEELVAIDTRLKYLSNAMDKHNKFDWKGITINTVIAISIALSLNPEQGSKLFHLFTQVFSHIIYLLPSA